MGRPPAFSWSDACAYGLCLLAILQLAHGVLQAGSLEASLELLARNPMLGGQPLRPSAASHGSANGTDGNSLLEGGVRLPTWTYTVGHTVGGVATAVVMAALLIPVLELRNMHGAPVREQLRGKRDDARGLGVTTIALLGSAPLIAPLHKQLLEGQWGYFYYDPSEHGGYLYIAAATLLQLVVSESHFYWLHRLMHMSPFYELFHKVHHTFVPSTATCAEAFHPIDLAALTLGTMWVPLMVPVYHPSFLGVLFFNAVYSVFQHTGSRTNLRIWFLNDAHSHNIHHDYGKRPVNCGSITNVWDRLCGTYVVEVPRWARTKWEGKGLAPAVNKDS